MFCGFVKTVTLAKSTELWRKAAPGERFRLPSRVSKYRGLRGEVPQQPASPLAPHLGRAVSERGVGGEGVRLTSKIIKYYQIFMSSRLFVPSNLPANWRSISATESERDVLSSADESAKA